MFLEKNRREKIIAIISTTTTTTTSSTTTKLVSGYKTSTERPCVGLISWRSGGGGETRSTEDGNKLAHALSPADGAKRTLSPEGACTLAPKEK